MKKEKEEKYLKAFVVPSGLWSKSHEYIDFLDIF